MTILNLKKTWTNTTLFEFGLGKCDIRQFYNYSLTIFDFILPPSYLSRFIRWVNNKLK